VLLGCLPCCAVVSTAEAVARHTDQDMFELEHSGTQIADNAETVGSEAWCSGRKSLVFPGDVALVPHVRPAELVGRCRGVSVTVKEAKKPYVRPEVAISHNSIQWISVNLHITPALHSLLQGQMRALHSLVSSEAGSDCHGHYTLAT